MAEAKAGQAKNKESDPDHKGRVMIVIAIILASMTVNIGSTSLEEVAIACSRGASIAFNIWVQTFLNLKSLLRAALQEPPIAFAAIVSGTRVWTRIPDDQIMEFIFNPCFIFKVRDHPWQGKCAKELFEEKRNHPEPEPPVTLWPILNGAKSWDEVSTDQKIAFLDSPCFVFKVKGGHWQQSCRDLQRWSLDKYAHSSAGLDGLRDWVIQQCDDDRSRQCYLNGSRVDNHRPTPPADTPERTAPKDPDANKCKELGTICLPLDFLKGVNHNAIKNVKCRDDAEIKECIVLIYSECCAEVNKPEEPVIQPKVESRSAGSWLRSDDTAADSRLYQINATGPSVDPPAIRTIELSSLEVPGWTKCRPCDDGRAAICCYEISDEEPAPPADSPNVGRIKCWECDEDGEDLCCDLVIAD